MEEQTPLSLAIAALRRIADANDESDYPDGYGDGYCSGRRSLAMIAQVALETIDGLPSRDS